MNYPEISEETARLANDANSMRDYRPGSATAEYRAAVDEAAALVEEQKKRVSPFYHGKLDALLESYSRRLAAYYNAYYRNEAACPSILISGGSNFPVRKKNKQNARRETLMQEYRDIQNILDKIRSIGTGAIDFADPHAREMLVERLEAAKADHARHLEANAYYRKHKTLDGCPGIHPKEREWLTQPGVFAKGNGSPLALYGVPFPPYALQSDNAAIKRYAERLEKYDKIHQQEGDEDTGTEFDGGRIVRNVEQDRLQILFDEKPGEEMRDKLKRNGFRWSPKNQTWQRQLTDNAERAAREVLNIPFPSLGPTEPASADPAGVCGATKQPTAPAEDIPTSDDGQALFPLT